MSAMPGAPADSGAQRQPLVFIVPGRLDQITGGYLYDRRIVEGLRATGWKVAVRELPGRFPDGDETARRAGTVALATLAEGSAVAIDGLALAAFAECLGAAVPRLRLVAMVHHKLALETGLPAATAARFAALERRLLPLFRGVICPSTQTADAVAADGVARQRIAIVPPGTDRPAVAARRPRTGPLRLLAVGSVTPRKGHLVLIEALSRLAGEDWRLTCIGSLTRDPPTVAALRRAIQRYRLGARVNLAGEWPPARLGEAYAEADIFILPSFYEGYGMAYAEAMAHGLPIVATQAGAIPETVPESAGLLVPPGDPAALAAALRRLFAEPALRRRLAAGARAAAAQLPDWDHAVRRWGEAFDRLAG
jgi:glycosyltransferase involved in cell wall biosynthesis